MSLEQHRSTFIFATAICVPVLFLVQRITSGGAYSSYGYPLLGLYLAWVLLSLIMRRHSIELLMKMTFWIIALFWLGMLAVRLYSAEGPASTVQRLTPNLYMVFIVLSIMAHLLFGTRTSLKASLGLLTGTILISLGWIIGQSLTGEYGESLIRLLSYEAVLAVSILLLYSLSKSKDDYAEALLETERVRNMAYTDTVTDLPNRRRLEEDLERQKSLTIRHEHPLSVIIFDIDRFKEVNDKYGHHAGDEVLDRTGKLVRSLLRAGDVFGRWGGEEFLIIAPETDRQQALALAERLRQAIEEHEFPNGISVTASFGAVTRAEGTAIDDLVKQADKMLYHAKDAGRNSVAA